MQKQTYVVKFDSRNLYFDNLVFIGTEEECINFAYKNNEQNRKAGDYFYYRVRDFFNGRTIYIDNKFAGEFVNNLTDYIGETLEWRQKQLSKGPIGEHKFEGINCLPYKIYGRRKVFSIQHGSVNQILTRNLTNDDLVWINI